MNRRNPTPRPALESLEGRITPTPIVDPPFANFGQEVSTLNHALNTLPDRGASLLALFGFKNSGGAVSTAARGG